MTNNIAEALNLAVELISAQQAEIQSHNESYQQLATINQQLSNELTTYKQREADAQVTEFYTAATSPRS